MARIGSWGPNLTFEVNSRKQLPFTKMKRSVKARWATHNLFGEKPKMEFQGVEQTSVTMEVTFSAQRGQSPYACLTKLQNECILGNLHYLYIGGHRIGRYMHYIGEISSDWKEVWNRGELVRVTVQITFMEDGG